MKLKVITKRHSVVADNLNDFNLLEASETEKNSAVIPSASLIKYFKATCDTIHCDVLEDSQDPDLEEDIDSYEMYTTKLEDHFICKQNHRYTQFCDVFWYLVSQYIAPESVAKFACICRSSYNITKTCAFWKSLYFRNYKEPIGSWCDKDLIDLGPWAVLNSKQGLRARVIRSLFIMHPISLNVTQDSTNVKLDILQGMMCQDIRHVYRVACQLSNTEHTVLFIFSRDASFVMAEEITPASWEDAPPEDVDIHHPDEGQYALLVTCHGDPTSALSMEMIGQRLFQPPYITLAGRDFFRQRLSLKFVREVDRYQLSCNLDHVKHVSVTPWWRTNFVKLKYHFRDIYSSYLRSIGDATDTDPNWDISVT